MFPLHKKPGGSKKIVRPKAGPLIENVETATLAENLYKKNIELLTTNKTLSLLSKLYEISILTLNPKDLAMRISKTIQVDLSFELAGIFIFESESNALEPLAFSKSERFKTTLEKLSVSLEDIKIPNITKRSFFHQTISSRKENMTNNLAEIWGDLIEPQKLQSLASESHIKTTLLCPLMIERKVLGMIMLALNRNYEVLSSFEKESMKTFVNVIALALEKAYLYQKLENANAQLRELDRQKDELLGIIAHQLSKPLTAVRWDLESFLEGDLGVMTEKQKTETETMRTQVVGLADLVSMILDVSRIQLGKMQLAPQPLDLDQFFKEILDVVRPTVLQKKLNFVIHLPEKMPIVLLDKRYTRMTIENLLTNAVKFTPEGGDVTLDVQIKDGVMHGEVTDTGCGIPKTEQDKIFGKMFRASNVRNAQEGNGFGLYVAKGAIEGQGGKIWFESTEGKGTTFSFALPMKEAVKKG